MTAAGIGLSLSPSRELPFGCWMPLLLPHSMAGQCPSYTGVFKPVPIPHDQVTVKGDDCSEPVQAPSEATARFPETTSSYSPSPPPPTLLSHSYKFLLDITLLKPFAPKSLSLSLKKMQPGDSFYYIF